MIEMRELIRRMPGEHGITVFLSSHLLSEVEQMATHVGIIGCGHLLFEGTLESLRSRSRKRVLIEIDRPVVASSLLAQAGWPSKFVGDTTLTVELPGQESVARAAAALVSAGVSIYQIRTERPSLENLFLDLTKASSFGSHTQEAVLHE
jgi:ABC-2 type transport system ATP-binding protein